MELAHAPTAPPEPHRRAAESRPPAAPAREPAVRLASLDVFRGLTMLFMASEIMRIPAVARQFTGSPSAQWLAYLLDHVEWTGFVPWDLIQPSFMFMVGVALPFSVASRRTRGEPFRAQLGHAVRRAFILVALGILLRSIGRPQTYFTFEDVLTQIGLGYVFLFLLAHASARTQLVAASGILFATWLAFALYPLPPAGFDTAIVGVPADWPHHLQGFAAHWDKNTNLANRVDQWFLNLFPRESPFVFNRGGYTTLNFVPSLATMIFGLLAGEVLRGPASAHAKLRRLLGWGLAGIVLGAVLHFAGVAPLVKRIWTPSWAIFSAGWAAVFLAFFYWVVDVRAWRRWTLPFLVVGMNSIAMYVIVHVAEGWMRDAFRTHLGRGTLQVFGAAYEPIVVGALSLLVFWLMLYWMYRRKIFIRI